MSKQNVSTGLMKLIVHIETHYEWFLSHSPEHGVIPEIIRHAKSLLPYDRNCIEIAYNQGDSDRNNQDDGNDREFKNCMDYFNKTFEYN